MQTNLLLNKTKLGIFLQLIIIRIDFTLFFIYIPYTLGMRLQVAKLQLLFSKFQKRYLYLYILYIIL